MPVLFISHSSKDDAVARALEAWLHAKGFTDIFIDHTSIVVGEKWAEALRDASGTCRVVACLVTQPWLASDECFGEYKAAWYLGKRIIPLFLLAPKAKLGADAKKRFADICTEYQGLDLTPCLKSGGKLDPEADQSVAGRLAEGLRAAGALAKVGLDPEAFAVDRKLRPMPFLGLASFGDDDADAALFYGRSGEIAEALEELRQMRAKAERRPFVILGASGAGKSSLLKAGIIPRLRREAPAWLPLRAFRPGVDPLLNFAEALARTFGDFGADEALGDIRERLMGAWSKAERSDKGDLTPEGFGVLQAALETEGRKLREAAGRSTASILISVDQAEELARAEGDNGQALADYLRVALAAATSWYLAFTIRNDSLPELQSHRRFRDLKLHLYDLRAMPVFRFESVVEAPAKRYGVTVDSKLVDALVENGPEADALPLLAFALQRLWRQFAAKRILLRDHFVRIGSLKGLIDDAAERALRGLAPDEDVPLPSGPPAKQRDDLGSTTFVPALTQINDQGAVIRRVAAWKDFNGVQRELLERFQQWRLVVRKGEADGGTIEVAHEALFREWARLKSWLEPERARLEVLRSLQVDAWTWDRNDRDAGFLNHRGERLARSAELAADDRFRLTKIEFDYLAACQGAEDATRAKTERLQELVIRLAAEIGVAVRSAVEAYAGAKANVGGVVGGKVLGALMVLLALGGVGWWQQDFLREQYLWRWKMGPAMLTAEQEKEKAATPGAEFTECATGCPTMVVVPAGKFTMGSPEDEQGRDEDEGPQHEVTIAKPFAVGRTEVTFAEWDACVTAGACAKASDDTWGRGSRPVINVSWDNAKEYIAWLSRITGKEYRLLSEAEWEYAARADTTTTYSWGDEIAKDNANCDGCGSPWDDKQTAPVGSFKPNAFGLYDMHGNVDEWVEDVWHDNYRGAPVDGSAWLEGGDASLRVVRGGSWLDNPWNLRAASRGGQPSGTWRSNLGFRLARTLNP
jgi:formylglycine-generating enzyme required for sulfatase activity